MEAQGYGVKAEVICVGDELLSGLSDNTNATWLCGQMVGFGGVVVAVTTVGDQLEAIESALLQAGSRADFVVITGGLGPTSDDRTKDAALSYFGGTLVPVEEEIERIRLMFAERGLPLTDRNVAQGWVPDTAVVLSNHVGTAPGMEFRKGGTTYVFLPGVPAEMKHIFTRFQERWFGQPDLDTLPYVSSDITTVGIGESFVADTLSGWEKALPKELGVGYYPAAGMVRVRLSCRHQHPATAMARLQHHLVQAAAHFPQDAFLTFGKSWDQYFFEEMQSRGLSLATAESCTGGYLAHRVTTVPGSSAIFRGSIVAYHNIIKTEMLGVDPDILEAHGAVSRETVVQMAEAVCGTMGAEVGVAISGIAGPEGGTPEKPVGTVWVAVAFNGTTTAEKHLMGSHRLRNIEKSAIVAMRLILKMISNG